MLGDTAFQVPSWSMIDNPLSFKYRSADSLLITVGDSWTYGDSLGATKVRNGVDDTEYRLNHVYGNLMSEETGASWFNLALPGGSNILMLNWLEDLLKCSLPYKEITCIITLTESGRHEELQMIDRTLVTQQNVLNDILNRTYYAIKIITKRYPNVKFIVAHNFTDGDNSTIDLTELSWLEVMLDDTIQNGTRIVVSDHIDQMNYDARFPDVFEIIDRANARIDLLDACAFCNKEDSRHPTEVGHAMWADYLLDQL